MIERSEDEIMKNWRDDVSSPAVSVCTRTYNLEEYISETLDSFLMQETDFPFEIVIDDDCSTDDTVEVISRYVHQFPNIIRADFRKKNIGARQSLLKNMQRARGKYIAYCDGDDYWTDPLKLQKQVDFLEKNDEYVLTFSPLETVSIDGAVTQNPDWENTQDRESLEIQKYFLDTAPCTVCFRNLEIIKEYPFEYHCAPIDDRFLWSVLGEYGKAKYLKDIKASRYRRLPEGDYSGKTSLQRRLMNQQTFFALYMYYSRVGNKTLSGYFHRKAVVNSLVLLGRPFFVYSVMRSFLPKRIRTGMSAAMDAFKKICFNKKR